MSEAFDLTSLIVKHTQTMRTVDFLSCLLNILVCCNVDFADVTENGILCWNISLTFCILHKECFKERKQETRIECFVFRRDILIFYLDEIRRRFSNVLIEG